MLTMRSWMFLRQYAELRENLLNSFALNTILDLSSGAFEEISAAQVIVSVAASIFIRLADILSPATALKVFDDETVTTIGETHRKRAATLAQEGFYNFNAVDLRVVPEWPIVYWWDNRLLAAYQSASVFGEIAPCKAAQSTGDNTRFTRYIWEIPGQKSILNSHSKSKWCPLVKGAAGAEWIDPVTYVVRWGPHGLPIKAYKCNQSGVDTCGLANEDYYLAKIGIAFNAIGSTFSARVHRIKSVFESAGSSVFPTNLENAVCAMNSMMSREILASLNPTVNFQAGDVNRLPLFTISKSDQIFQKVATSFARHESHREPSLEFRKPGSSSWSQAQRWAQNAVDRAGESPLPDYIEELDAEPPTDHVSFALGIALGRFAPVDKQGITITCNPAGILDPASADLSHALPAGILFLDGSLAETDNRDGLGYPASQPLHKAWARYGPAISTNRNLRDWLRLDFFKDVHKGMYENRPIHWPLSSASKTFVAWVNIHRMDSKTLTLLLADYLNDGSLKRIDGELKDLRSARDGADRKAARQAEVRIGKLIQWREELVAFIDQVQQCADQGPLPPDARCMQRDVDAAYDPELDDGVMVNSAALWPLLEPQWKDPKKWWKELSTATGRKDYDWAQLAMRYWPARVDQKCQDDPSLGVAHGCFWRYHPARAWAWELRLQDEISPDFRIEEAPYRPGGRELGDAGDGPHRASWLADNPDEALAAVEKEASRRMGRGNNRKLVTEMTILEPGLWSALPKQVWNMELRLAERQGSEFRLIAPDEAAAREQLLAAHPQLAIDRRAFLQGLAPQGELAVDQEDELPDHDDEAGEDNDA